MTWRQLPEVVRLMMSNGACLTGSCVNYIFGECNYPKDIDLIVPPECWTDVSRFIPLDHTRANLGVCRFKSEGWVIDVREGNIAKYLRGAKSKNGLPVYVLSLMRG